jgi:hypothetical protein
MVTSLPDRLFLVIIIFLYSASLTCAMAQCTPHFFEEYNIIASIDGNRRLLSSNSKVVT